MVGAQDINTMYATSVGCSEIELGREYRVYISGNRDGGWTSGNAWK
jgi:hypothetical protein